MSLDFKVPYQIARKKARFDWFIFAKQAGDWFKLESTTNRYYH